jgi:hypothetical protein
MNKTSTKSTFKNVGAIDRWIRSVPMMLVACLYFGGALQGWSAAIGAIVAGMLLLTSLVGWCSVYQILGISTCPTKA